MMLPFQPWNRPIASDWKDNDEDLSVSSAPALGPSIVEGPHLAVQGGGEFANGVTMQATNGIYNNADTVVNQWYKNGVLIPGETGLTYVVSGFVDGDALYFGQEVCNEVDCIYPDSEVFVGYQPVNNDEPSVLIPGDGAPQLGEQLSANDGSWDLYNGTLTRKWFRDGVDTGQTGTTYTLTTADQDTDITLQVTVANSFGSVMVPSSNTIVIGMNPKIQVAPQIAYTFGQTPHVTVTPVWQLADTVTGIWRKNGADVAGQTTYTYTGTKQIGDSIRYRSIGDNAFSLPINSDSNAIVISGTADIAQVGTVLWIPSGMMTNSSQHAISQVASVQWGFVNPTSMGDSHPYSIAQSASILWTPSGTLV